ncbi:MAG: hypothetical protein ACRYFX_07015 [Janthinobacterium lividum]
MRLANEPGRPIVFVGAGELPPEDPTVDVMDRILGELPSVLPADGIPAQVLSHHFSFPVPDGLEDFPGYAYKYDTRDWTYYQLCTAFY